MHALLQRLTSHKPVVFSIVAVLVLAAAVPLGSAVLVKPEAAKAQEAEGTVFVDFIVATDGSIRNVVATDAAGEDVDQTLRDEAIRVVSSMPKWTPGRQHGKPVHVSYSLPITFQIN